VDKISSLFKFHNRSPLEKAYAVILYLAGLSLRDISERYELISASRESVREWVQQDIIPLQSFKEVKEDRGCGRDRF